QQRPECRSRMADVIVEQRLDPNAMVSIRVGILLFQPHGDGIHFGAGLFQIHTGLETRNTVQPWIIAAVLKSWVAGKWPQRRPDAQWAGEHEARWHDANHGISAPAKCDRLIDDSGIASEPVSPQLMAQHDERRRAGLVLFVVEEAPDSGLHPQCREDISR